MTNYYARQAAGYANEFKRSLGALVGIATGLLADRHLSDDEIRFLSHWLDANDAIAFSWPGDVLHARIKAVLADGSITESERLYMVETLQSLLGGTLDNLATSTHAADLAFDDVQTVQFPGSVFCLTGDFVYAAREICARAIESRGGIIKNSVTKKLNYLIVGGLGSPEWKHGSFGTKIEQAMRHKSDGLPLLIVHEDQWISSLQLSHEVEGKSQAASNGIKET
jgi:NAD-dependent DNA ligase